MRGGCKHGVVLNTSVDLQGWNGACGVAGFALLDGAERLGRISALLPVGIARPNSRRLALS